MEKNQMKRINVVGSSGSGKTFFSRKLADILCYPYVEMDQVFWGPNWYWPTDEEFFSNLRKAIAHDKWVLDGNYTRTVPIKWEAVDTVIWLDYSFTRTFFQSLKRAIKRSITQEELWEGTGNRESFKKSFFSKDSIILWMLKNHSKVRKKYEYYLLDKKFSHIKFIRIKSHAEAARFLSSIKDSM